MSRVVITHGTRSVIATLIYFDPSLLGSEEIGLSDTAYEALDLKVGEKVRVSLAEPPASFKFIRSHLYGLPFDEQSLRPILEDIHKGRYSDVQLSSFITSSVNWTFEETVSLARVMYDMGKKLSWSAPLVVGKHCIGGVPGNRTTMILVPLLAAFGLTIPKLSSRAITSPAGTADTMEVLAPVDLTCEEMHKVVEQEGGCIIWGGKTGLNPVEDKGAHIEHQLNFDLYRWLVPSLLSTKLALGVTHVLIDIPLGATTKIQTEESFKLVADLFRQMAKVLGLTAHVAKTDGSQPIGRGIGPVLEARDVLSVLRCEKNAPQDLRQKALELASFILEAWGGIPQGKGYGVAEEILEKGQALKKFEAICNAQGGMREPVLAKYSHPVTSRRKGIVTSMNNYLIAHVGRFAGAPASPGAGLELHVSVNAVVEKGQPLFTLYAQTPEELDYALRYVEKRYEGIVEISEF